MLDSKDTFLKPTEKLRNLQVLEEVARDSAISQRKLSNHLGVALGVTNACLKKMVRKGHIKVKGINHKRIAYYLTPEGFSEKARLAYHFLQHTIDYYVNLKKNISSNLDLISQAGNKRLLFYGAGEVMEVAFICLHKTDLELMGIIDDSKDKQDKRMFGFTMHGPEAIKGLAPDAVLITSIRYKDIIFSKLRQNKELEGINFYSL